MMSVDGLKREIASSGIGGAGTIPYELMMSIDGLKREIASSGIGGAGTIPSIAPKIIADSVKDLGNIPKSVEQTYSTITWEVRNRLS